jgi:D-alanine--poly(phosphoribitol) ligase subunit 2
MQKQEVLAVVLEAVAEWNEQADEEHQLEVAPATRLLGRSSKLDSFGLVNLIVTVEEKIADKFGPSLTLADERAMSQENSPFRSVQSLAEYAFLLLNEKKNA